MFDRVLYLHDKVKYRFQ